MNDDDVEKMKEDVAEMFSKNNHALNMENFESAHLSWRTRLRHFCEWFERKNPFSGYLYVKSADEYINLPWSKRSVWLFWYRDPLITSEVFLLGRKKDRDKLENFIKSNHPVQYFLRKKGFSLRVRLSAFKDWISNTINPRQKWLTKQIPKSWADKVWLITELNFAMVVDFVEGEKALETTDWEATGPTAAKFCEKLKDCYDYIKVRRPKIVDELEHSYPDEETRTGDYYVDYADHIRLEKLLGDSDTEYLTWIVTNRENFWT